MTALPRNRILVGDAAAHLRELPTASVDCVLTSVPFYALRDYQVPGQIGLEPTVDEWVERLRVVMGEVARVLKPTGVAWVEVGDAFARHRRYGAPRKSLLLAPQRLALALLADGWWLRSEVIYGRLNPLPSSVTDRLTVAHTHLFMLTRAEHYYFDLDSIRLAHRSARQPSQDKPDRTATGPLGGSRHGLAALHAAGRPGHVLGRNPGTVWMLPAANYRGPHAATFPPALCVRPIVATCPEAVCTKCGRPWRRRVTATRPVGRPAPIRRQPHLVRFAERYSVRRQIGELVPCGCQAPTRPGVVLDPFGGVATTALVAERLGRDWVLVELNPTYAALGRRRLAEDRKRAGPARTAAA